MILKRRAMVFFLSLLVVPLVFSSCTLWNMRDWQGIKDRKFYFQEFTYRLSGHERRIAYRFMKDFPVKPMLQILSEHFNIEIDSTEFEKFLTKEDGDLDMNVTGVITNEFFTWKGEASPKNTVEFSYTNQYLEESTDFIRKYQVVLKTDGKKRAVFEGVIKNMGDVLPSLKEKIKKQ